MSSFPKHLNCSFLFYCLFWVTFRKACARLFSEVSFPPMRLFDLQTESKAGTKRLFSLTNLPKKKKNLRVWSFRCAAGCQCFPPWPISSGEFTRVRPNKHRLFLFSASLLQLFLLCFFFPPTAGSCLQCHLCKASFCCLSLGLLITCQVPTVLSTAPSLPHSFMRNTNSSNAADRPLFLSESQKKKKSRKTSVTLADLLSEVLGYAEVRNPTGVADLSKNWVFSASDDFSRCVLFKVSLTLQADRAP